MGAVGLLLAIAGLYGVVAYNVSPTHAYRKHAVEPSQNRSQVEFGRRSGEASKPA